MKYCVCYTNPTQKLFCLHVFCQAGLPQRVDYLAPRWEIVLSVFWRTQTQQRAATSGVEQKFHNLSNRFVKAALFRFSSDLKKFTILRRNILARKDSITWRNLSYRELRKSEISENLLEYLKEIFNKIPKLGNWET